MDVRRVRADEWEAVRELRLRALAADPTAFSSTHAREAAFPDSLWRSRVLAGAESTEQATFVAAATSGRWVGMATIAGEAGGARSIFGMWVDPEYRRQGVGGALLDACVVWSGTERPVRLEVFSGQEEAVALYRSRGFRLTGNHRAVEHRPEGVDEMQLPPRGPAQR